jgi:hypothetical protein
VLEVLAGAMSAFVQRERVREHPPPERPFDIGDQDDEPFRAVELVTVDEPLVPLLALDPQPAGDRERTRSAVLRSTRAAAPAPAMPTVRSRSPTHAGTANATSSSPRSSPAASRSRSARIRSCGNPRSPSSGNVSRNSTSRRYAVALPIFHHAANSSAVIGRLIERTYISQ